ncbi:MAG TPA: glucose 1-dehydrogenase [Dehalococcoidia bacterium]|nr:glucose 1-dehydrogenase [Dehalococcoidia bacterium]
MDVGALFAVNGKTAIVTGASSGLGERFAEVLAGAGANVVLAARRTERLNAVAKRIEDTGGTALVNTCDVSDSPQVQALMQATCRRFGRVDILVNNAGLAAEAGLMPERIPDELFAQTIQVNLNGVYFCCRAAAEHMLADGKGGSIINIASIMGMSGQQNGPVAYQASKAAVINVTRNLACSWADRGVRVNCIAPGWFESELTAGWFAVPQFLARFKAQAPMSRIGRRDELDGVLLFLASDASSFVTGQTLAVDGGLSAAVSGPQYDEELFAMQAAIIPGGLGERIMPA